MPKNEVSLPACESENGIGRYAVVGLISGKPSSAFPFFVSSLKRPLLHVPLFFSLIFPHVRLPLDKEGEEERTRQLGEGKTHTVTFTTTIIISIFEAGSLR